MALALEEEGLSVFWDRRIPVGQTWSSYIEEALDEASVVMVLWTTHSIKSESVIAEADHAREQKKLVPVLLDAPQPPLGFGAIKHADLTNWDGSHKNANFEKLVEDVLTITEHHLGRPEPADLPGQTVAVDTTRNYMRLPRAPKTKVFVAHASADKPKLQPILLTLIDQGFRLWVDKPQQIGLGSSYESRLAADRIQYGQDWRESIRLAVSSADAVLAFWSEDAVNGRREQFHYEVYMGMMQKKLNQCRIDSVRFKDIGMPYTFDHIADLSQVSLGAYHPELDYLMQDMTRRRRTWWHFW
jgi:hypothetical protein